MRVIAFKAAVRESVPLLTALIIILGAALRVGLFLSIPPPVCYDDHIEVSLYHASHGELPLPDLLREGYQPPLFHLLGSFIYQSVAGGAVADKGWAEAELERRYGPDACLAYKLKSDVDPYALPDEADVANPLRRHCLAVKAIQGISLLAGIGALLLCWAALRRIMRHRPWNRLIALLVAALLPRHIYMSAMATNDALAAFCVTLAVYLLIRFCQRPTWRAATTCGIAAGLACLSKGTGLVILPTIAGGLAVLVWTRRQDGSDIVRRRCAQAAIMLALAVAVGAWPYLRLARLYGNPFVSNADIFSRTRIHEQPPGKGNVRYLSFRPLALWKLPFVHQSTVDSWPTAIYARLWFDYEPVFTQWRFPPYVAFDRSVRAMRTYPSGSESAERLNWPMEAMPAAMVWQARCLYLLGAPVTMLTLWGLFVSRRIFSPPAWAVFLVLTAGSMFIVLYQSIRQPHFSSFKSAFLLTALLPMAAWAGCGAMTAASRLRRAGMPMISGLAVALAAAVTVHVTYVSVVYHGRLGVFWGGAPAEETYWNMGNRMLDQANLDKAIAYYDEALRIHPDDNRTLNNLGIALLKANRTEEAAERFEQALQADEADVRAHRNLARALANLKRPDEAETHYRATLTLDPNQSDVHNELADVLESRGKTDEAAEQRRAAQVAQPGDAESRNAQAIALVQVGRLDEAIALWREALTLDSKNVSCLINMGNAMSVQGKAEEALAFYRQAVAASPGNPTPMMALAMEFENQGRSEEARQTYQEVIRLDPSHAEARRRMGGVSPPSGRDKPPS